MDRRLLIAGLVVLALIASRGRACAQLPERAPGSRSANGWRMQAGIQFGWVAAGKEIGRHPNASGGEMLHATFESGPVIGFGVALFRRFGGVEGFAGSAWPALRVENEAGEIFPNHAERPELFSGQLVLYPLGGATGGSGVRPFARAGFSAALLSADMDNRDGQSAQALAGWTYAAGCRWWFRTGPDRFFEVEAGRHRFRASRPYGGFDIWIVRFGLGYGF